MTYSVVLTRRAQRDLMTLYDYIAEESGEGRAEGYIDRIQRFCQSLGTSPMRGTARDELKRGLRVVGFERRVAIAFQVKGNQVIVARVLYGGRDLAKAFSHL